MTDAIVTPTQHSDLQPLVADDYLNSIVVKTTTSDMIRTRRWLPQRFDTATMALAVVMYSLAAAFIAGALAILLVTIHGYGDKTNMEVGLPLLQILSAGGLGFIAAVMAGFAGGTDELLSRWYDKKNITHREMPSIASVKQHTTATTITLSILSVNNKTLRRQEFPIEDELAAHETVIAWERDISDYQEHADVWMDNYQQQLAAAAEADAEARRVQQRLEATVIESNRRLTSKS